MLTVFIVFKYSSPRYNMQTLSRWSFNILSAENTNIHHEISLWFVRRKEVKSTRRNLVASNDVFCLIFRRCDKTLTWTFDNETWFGIIAESSFKESEFFLSSKELRMNDLNVSKLLINRVSRYVSWNESYCYLNKMCSASV